jgi:hypothetical protein
MHSDGFRHETSDSSIATGGRLNADRTPRSGALCGTTACPARTDPGMTASADGDPATVSAIAIDNAPLESQCIPRMTSCPSANDLATLAGSDCRKHDSGIQTPRK